METNRLERILKRSPSSFAEKMESDDGLRDFLQHQFVNRAQNQWVWPLYRDEMARRRFSQIGRVQPGSNLRKRIASCFERIASAAYIEWKYLSVLSPQFHGIIGLSIYNPEERFSQLAEGGLLVLIAGAVQPSHSNSSARQDFVWMELFPISQLKGLETEELTGHSATTDFSLKEQSGNIEFSLQHTQGLKTDLRITQPESANPASPLLGSDVNPLRFGHWVVDNRIPVGLASGHLTCSGQFLKSLNNDHNASTFWNPSHSQSTAELACHFQAEPAYFEHSFGIHPLPAQGWDFLFAPLKNSQGGAVLQSYKGSDELTRLDIYWAETQADRGTKMRRTSFHADELMIDWVESETSKLMQAKIPVKRSLLGQNEHFEIRLQNRISTTLPFLRPQTPAVRCFFIGEQLSSARWILSDRHSQKVFETNWTRAGGEIAYPRLAKIGALKCPFPRSSRA